MLGGLLWASTGIMFGWYAQANMPMLTVMVFLPAAFAFVFRAVGMYHTEDPLKPRTSVQAAAIAALCFIPVVAAEPQLLFALIVVFLMFLLFVRRKRAMLLLIPVPAAFAVAPTLRCVTPIWACGVNCSATSRCQRHPPTGRRRR